MFSDASNTDSVANAQQLPQAPCERGSSRYSFHVNADEDTEHTASPTTGSNGLSTFSDLPVFCGSTIGESFDPSGCITEAPRIDFIM